MAETPRDVAAFQIGRGSLETYKDTNQEKLISLVGDRIAGFADRLRAANERITRIRQEVLSDPDLFREYLQIQAAQAHSDVIMNQELEQLAQNDRIAKVERLHRYVPLGSCILFDNTNFGGTAK